MGTLERRIAALEAMHPMRTSGPGWREILRRLSDGELAVLEELAEGMDGAIACGEPVGAARERFAHEVEKLIPQDVMQRPLAPLLAGNGMQEARR